MSILLVNIPFLTIRVVVRLHYTQGRAISLMVIKNALFIVQDARELFHLVLKSKKVVNRVEPLTIAYISDNQGQ